jgi:hypothetical protein
MKQIQNLINHVVLVIDESGSMQGKPVEKVVDKELNNLKVRSKELDQETRVSIYLFNHKVQCLAFDMDVMRFETMKGLYNPDHQTALIDATIQGVKDSFTVSQIHGDHAFLIYVITDGQENASKSRPVDLTLLISAFKDNFTIACLVPDQNGVFEAKKFGFPSGCISIWDTNSSTGFEKVGQQFSGAMENYMTMRSTGVRSTKGLFTMDSSFIAKSNLEPVNFGYRIFGVMADGRIDEVVQQYTGRSYVVGSTFYQPTKPVEIQDYKGILVQNIQTGAVYGGENIRQMLGLPNNTVKVNPGQHKDWRIFVQSTSVNRKLFSGTQILVRMDY